MKLKDLPIELLSTGRYTVTTTEAANLTGWSQKATAVGLSRLASQGEMFSPARGLYVVVPPEFHSWRVTPADWFIDDLMRYTGRNYYVALLSAAAMHGASHHAPQVFQVMTDKRTRDLDIQRVRLRFFRRNNLADIATEQRNTKTGVLRVSTKEATLLDLVAHAGDAGGLSNVATIAMELEHLNGDVLSAVAHHYPRAVVRRAGWLLSEFVPDAPAEALREMAAPSDGEADPLSPGAPATGAVDKSWAIRVNTTVEPDL